MLVKQLVELLLFICVGHLVQADNEDLFSCIPSKELPRDPWINNLVQEKQLFFANIEVVDLTNKSVSLLDESYDFLNNTGEYKFQHQPAGEEVRVDYAKYFGDSIYKYSDLTNKCSKNAIGETEKEFLLQWLPKGNGCLID